MLLIAYQAGGMSGFVFDPSEKGLRKVLKDYQELALRVVWEAGEEGATSGEVWEEVSGRLVERESISRASIIFFLNDMVDDGVLGFREESGKGGMHRVYYPLMDEAGYKKYLFKTMVQSMIQDYPEEAREVLKEYLESP
jgi:predicted transcriptional regulator